MSEKLPPILARQGEEVSLRHAADILGMTTKAASRVVNTYQIGWRVTENGRLNVHRVALEMAKYGDREAIELLRADEREHPLVARYFRVVGLPT